LKLTSTAIEFVSTFAAAKVEVEGISHCNSVEDKTTPSESKPPILQTTSPMKLVPVTAMVKSSPTAAITLGETPVTDQ
jgi:hypothetical protein